ncbi:unnamed protein product [Peronospora belbahrii]|uniref:Uncharacterized protein n=1 Tax=Peronospora belbahrii TaxID=622444 RepID=A0ABN8CQ81_9STRA|nr:unnamed protein product [Peronospora belbahrii]
MCQRSSSRKSSNSVRHDKRQKHGLFELLNEDAMVAQVASHVLETQGKRLKPLGMNSRIRKGKRGKRAGQENEATGRVDLERLWQGLLRCPQSP